MAARHNGPNDSGARDRAERPRRAGRAGATSPAGSPVSESVRKGVRVAKEIGQVVVERAAEKAAELKQKVGSEGDRLFNQRKRAAVQGLGQVGAAIRQAADRLYEDRGERVAGFIEAAADGIDGAARYLEERDLATLARDAGALVRRRPAWFLGAMLVAGVAVGRFIKAGAAEGEAHVKSNDVDRD